MKRVLVLGFLSLLPLTAMAQDNPKLEVFGGYQYLHIGSNTNNGITSSGQGFNGWNAAATANLGKYLGVEGDFSGTYASIGGVGLHLYTYAGGPVISREFDRIKPFAHVLLGGVRLTGSESGVSVSFNGFTLLAGGGVDYKVNKLLAVRAIQADWIYYHFGSQTIAGVGVPGFSGSNNVRISTGVVFRF